MKKLLKDLAFTYPLKIFSASVVAFTNLFGLAYPQQMTRATPSWANAVWITLIVLFAFVGDRILSEVLQSINLSSEFRYSRLYDSRAQSNIVLLGNSRGHTLYQPAIRELTGTATINLSYNALPASVARALVEDYYDLYTPPDKLIIEVSMLVKTDSGVINEFKTYIKESERLERIVRNTSARTATACMISNIYIYNSEIFHRSLYYLTKEDSDWILDKRINDGLLAGSDNIKPMVYEITKDRMNDFLALVQTARKKGTDVKLVLAPYFPAYRGEITNLEGFIVELESKTGLEVHDYSRFLNDANFFSDYLHLNKSGSELFMQRLHRDGVI